MAFLYIIVALILVIWVFLQQPKFGRIPTGARLERIRKSPNFKKGKFQNLSHTPDLSEGANLFTVLVQFVFGKSKRAAPSEILPSKKTDLMNLDRVRNVLVWFGHSSYFMQIDGKRILVDPVFSGSASPLPGSVKSFKGTDVYTTDDIPEIDYLFISHDHWDHLDYVTIRKLKSKISKVVTGLGTAEHLEYWGYDIDKIIERDWNEEIVLEEGFVVNTLPARHFSGRGFQRQKSIWMSFALRTPSMNIFIGGDSGYDTHFASIGEKFGPFDLAILECGQYHVYWKYIHMLPDEVIQAALDLKAKKLLPVHWGKFVLALHAWDEPIIAVSSIGKKKNLPVLTPMIGEALNLGETQEFSSWWTQV